MPILGDFTVLQFSGTPDLLTYEQPLTVGSGATSFADSTTIAFGTGGVETNTPGLLTMMVRGMNRTAEANVRITSEFVGLGSPDSFLGKLQGLPNSLQGQWFQQQFRIKTNMLSPADSDTANLLHLGVAQLQRGSGNFVEYEVRDIVVYFHQST